MKTRIRKISHFLLVSLLAAGQASYAQQDALGSILNAASAEMNSSPASAGTTVFGGSHLLTGTDGMLLVQVGAAQLYLGGTSAATLRRGVYGAEASLEAGMLSVSTNHANSLSIAMGGASLRPAADVPSYAQVTLIEPRVYLITILRDSWKFKYQCEEQTLAQGTSYHLILDRTPECASAANSSQKGVKQAPGGSHSTRTILLVAAAGGGAGAAVWALHSRTNSPSAP